MMLTTLFGTAQLAMQGAISAGLDALSTTPRAPNFIVVRLGRAPFIAEYRGQAADEIERFRRELELAMRGFVTSHGWIIGGSGVLFLNILLDEIDECRVEARVARSVYTLGVRDDRGERSVPVGSNPATVGRQHEPSPRGFIPLHDGRKLLSREHLILTYRDLRLSARLLGRNPTTLNGAPMGSTETELKRGDTIACGDCMLRVELIEG